MTRIFALSVAATVLLLSSTAQAQYCPSHFDGPPMSISDSRPPPRGTAACLGGGGAEPPNPSGPGGSPPGGGGPSSKASAAECVGDPVAIFGTHSYTFDRIEDFMVRTALGEVSFQRSFVSSDLPWRGGRTEVPTPLAGIPKPFGASRVAGDDSQRWSHNFFSFIDAAHGQWRVRPPRGTEDIFSKCSSAPCWALRPSDSPGEQSRLQWVSSGAFRFFQNDGKQYEYANATPDAGYYFLTRTYDESGRLLAIVNYAKPTSDCPGFIGIADSGLPFISSIETNGGPAIAFTYAPLGSECVVSSVAVGGTTVATYEYQSNQPGHLAQATTLDFDEAYSGYQQGFSVTRSASIVGHTFDAGTIFSPTLGAENDWTVVAATDPTGQWSIAPELVSNPVLPDGGSVCGGNACCTASNSRRVDLVSAGRGDGLDAGASFFSIFYYATGSVNGGVEGHQPTVRIDQCPANAYSCSEGTEKWYWRGIDLNASCGASNPAYLNAVKDKRDNWTVTPHRIFDAGAGLIAFEQTAFLRGVPSTSGPTPDPGTNDENALERSYYTHVYIDGGEYLATETRPSALTSGDITTTYTRNDRGWLTATFVSGSSMLLDGGLEARVVANFTSCAASQLMSA